MPSSLGISSQVPPSSMSNADFVTFMMTNSIGNIYGGSLARYSSFVANNAWPCSLSIGMGDADPRVIIVWRIHWAFYLRTVFYDVKRCRELATPLSAKVKWRRVITCLWYMDFSLAHSTTRFYTRYLSWKRVTPKINCYTALLRLKSACHACT